MFKMKKRHKICEKIDHENIDVLVSFRFGEGKKWEDRVCKKCFIPERLQDNKEYIKSINDAEKNLIELGFIKDEK